MMLIDFLPKEKKLEDKKIYSELKEKGEEFYNKYKDKKLFVDI